MVCTKTSPRLAADVPMALRGQDGWMAAFLTSTDERPLWDSIGVGWRLDLHCPVDELLSFASVQTCRTTNQTIRKHFSRRKGGKKVENR